MLSGEESWRGYSVAVLNNLCSEKYGRRSMISRRAGNMGNPSSWGWTWSIGQKPQPVRASACFSSLRSCPLSWTWAICLCRCCCRPRNWQNGFPSCCRSLGDPSACTCSPPTGLLRGIWPSFRSCLRDPVAVKQLF